MIYAKNIKYVSEFGYFGGKSIEAGHEVSNIVPALSSRFEVC